MPSDPRCRNSARPGPPRLNGLRARAIPASPPRNGARGNSSCLVAKCLPISVDSPNHKLSRIRNEKRPSMPESEPVQGGRLDGWATTCPQSWDLLNREIRVATCTVRPLYDLVAPLDVKLTFHSQSDRGAIYRLKISGGR
jgi:hypothetical protein